MAKPLRHFARAMAIKQLSNAIYSLSEPSMTRMAEDGDGPDYALANIYRALQDLGVTWDDLVRAEASVSEAPRA